MGGSSGGSVCLSASDPDALAKSVAIALSSVEEGGNVPNVLRKPAKRCPDFKDEPEQSACCPSQITAGAFFCCTEDLKADWEAKLAAAARREFISNHVFELVLCSLGFLVFLFLFCSFLCRRTRFCPMLHRRKATDDDAVGCGGTAARRRYRTSLSLNSTTTESICRPTLVQQNQPAAHRVQRPFTTARPYHHQQQQQQQQQFHRLNEQPLFPSSSNIGRKEEYDAPPPYSLVADCSSSAPGPPIPFTLPPPPPPSAPSLMNAAGTGGNIVAIPPPPLVGIGTVATGQGSTLLIFGGGEEEQQNRLNSEREAAAAGMPAGID